MIMTNENDCIELSLEGKATEGLWAIASYFDGDLVAAIERAIGTELLLLRYVEEGGTIIVETDRKKVVVDLFGVS